MTAQTIRFNTQLLQTGATTTGIVVPPEVIAQLAAGGRPALVVSVNGYSYRTTVGVMGGKSMLPFSAAHREASGLKGGDPVEVEVALDLEPRTVELPGDLEAALAAAPGLRAAFLKQAPSRQKADVEAVAGAKAADTRARRIAAILAKLQV